MTRTRQPARQPTAPASQPMNLRLGIKRIEYRHRRAYEGEMVVDMHATFEMRADEMPTAEFTIIVQWQKDLPTTMNLLVQKLGEIGQKIQQLAEQSAAIPMTTPHGQ